MSEKKVCISLLYNHLQHLSYPVITFEILSAHYILLITFDPFYIIMT